LLIILMGEFKQGLPRANLRFLAIVDTATSIE
jgi:hypothetical protein